MSNPSSVATAARTKIIATVGPACREPAQLKELVEAGADLFRLNMAHGEVSQHAAVMKSIRDLSRQLNRPIATLVDLAGPKIRLGEISGGVIECQPGAEYRFIRGEQSQKPAELVCNYVKLIEELAVNDRVMLADGTVAMTVLERGADFAHCKVTQPGLIRSRQGINLPGVKISLPAMSDDDRAHAAWAADNGADFVSLSFVRSPDDVRALKTLLRARSSHARVIAKIEKQEALDHLEEIVSAADGVMVARGDLGVEIDVARMPVVQKQIVNACNEYKKPVIIATQMLDSMQHSQRPTRAETTDVANAILDGCDACMLSGETAVGQYPRAAVEMMNRIARATEPLFRTRPPQRPSDVLPEGLRPITQAAVYGAGHMAQQLGAQLLVAVTNGGATALALSKQRNYVPVIGVSGNDATLRQMCLYWGVIPLQGAPTSDSIRLLEHLEAWGLKDGCLKAGDRIVLVAGVGLASQGHNMVRVHEVGGSV